MPEYLPYLKMHCYKCRPTQSHSINCKYSYEYFLTKVRIFKCLKGTTPSLLNPWLSYKFF